MPRTNAGSHWEPELKIYPDPVSGATIHQLTDYKAHSCHFYFTYPGWFDEGRKIVFGSDRENRSNLFSADLQSGEIVQLTDLDPVHGEPKPQSVTLNPKRPEAYFHQGRTLMALNLETLALRALYTTPAGFNSGSTAATADGRSLIIGLSTDLSDRILMDLGHGYIGFHEYWAAHPRCLIQKMDLDTGDVQVVYQEDSWLGHLNPSTTQANIMTFCHEGPWNLVDNRIWGLNLDTGEAWKIRPTGEGEMVGHEYWMPDGKHIGYHGKVAGETIYGSIGYDNSDRVEAPFAFHSWHFHSYNLDLVVGDGDAENAYLMLWRHRNGAFEGPRYLAWHRGSFHTQQVHVHPCFSPDGKHIVYTADPQGYGQVFMVDIPEFESLPEKPGKSKEA
jgi:oligogalacturonide lyase